MSRQAGILVFGGLLAGFLLIAFLVHAVTSRPAPPRPPELGGQQVPAELYEIAFDQKYDLFCSFYQEEPTTFLNCEILGFTGREESEGSGRGFLSSASGSYRAREYFDDWLVLKLADGRLAYIPPNAVRYIEQARPE